MRWNQKDYQKRSLKLVVEIAEPEAQMVAAGQIQ